jgi:alkaline phosphatase D
LAGLAGLVTLLLTSTLTQAETTRIAFGSCSHQDKPQPVWQPVIADKPEMFIMLGDNIYADSDDPDVLAAKYQTLAAIPGFAALRRQTQLVGTWDDHDYGQNDAGKEYVAKDASRQLLLDFFAEPANSARRSQEGGIYTSYWINQGPHRVQVILLDLRWNRTDLVKIEDSQRLRQRYLEKRGPYEASLSKAASMVGEAQWQWLEAQLQKPADVRIIGSSIQLLAEFTGWETWANFPRDRQRFIDLLAVHQQEPVIIISGDVHWTEFSQIEQGDWPLIELTSSGLTEEWRDISPNRHRVGEAFAEANYGLIDITWAAEKHPAITLSVKNAQGAVLIEKRMDFARQ